MGLRGIRVSGQDYKFDYRYLDNKPEHIVPSTTGNVGKSLVVAENGSVKWDDASPEAYLMGLGNRDANTGIGPTDNNGPWPAETYTLTRRGSDVKWDKLFPSYDGEHDGGKFLTVMSTGSEWFLTWESVESAIPDNDWDDMGKVLCADGFGGAEWIETDELGIIPKHDVSDSGKSLCVDRNGEIEWSMVLPSHTSNDNGKVLAVADTEGTIDWLSIKMLLPAFSSSDEGKVLMIQDGNIVWGNPS
jgi:hypothetical protein